MIPLKTKTKANMTAQVTIYDEIAEFLASLSAEKVISYSIYANNGLKSRGSRLR